MPLSTANDLDMRCTDRDEDNDDRSVESCDELGVLLCVGCVLDVIVVLTVDDDEMGWDAAGEDGGESTGKHSDRAGDGGVWCRPCGGVSVL